jgi:hypothetical protein
MNWGTYEAWHIAVAAAADILTFQHSKMVSGTEYGKYKSHSSH